MNDFPEQKTEYCSCGFPQSHPIPHSHDLTEREKAILVFAQQQEREKIFAILDAARIAEHAGDIVVKSYTYNLLKYEKDSKEKR